MKGLNNKLLLITAVFVIVLLFPGTVAIANESAVNSKLSFHHTAAVSNDENKPASAYSDAGSQGDQTDGRQGGIHWEKLMICLLVGISFSMTGLFLWARISRRHKSRAGSLLSSSIGSASITDEPELKSHLGPDDVADGAFALLDIFTSFFS